MQGTQRRGWRAGEYIFAAFGIATVTLVLAGGMERPSDEPAAGIPSLAKLEREKQDRQATWNAQEAAERARRQESEATQQRIDAMFLASNLASTYMGEGKGYFSIEGNDLVVAGTKGRCNAKMLRRLAKPLDANHAFVPFARFRCADSKAELTLPLAPVADEESGLSPARATPRSCCRVCSSGVPCGDSCIAAGKTCHKGPGCAC